VEGEQLVPKPFWATSDFIRGSVYTL